MNTPEGVINYGYDLATGRHTETNTKNSNVQYGYDELGRLKTVTVTKRNGTTLTPAEMTTYGYDAVGNRSSVALPNGVTTTYLYDSLNRMTNLTHVAGAVLNASYSYKLDATGRRTNAVEVLLQESGGGYLTNTLAWAYDGLYRLTNEVSVSMSVGGTYAYTNAFVYDLAGNRLQQVKTGASVTTITNAYDANDALLREVTKVGGTLTDTNSYAYDDNGSMIGKTNATATMTYTYNVANKLNRVLQGGALLASYLYNDSGIRVSQTANGGNTTKYLIDANNHTGYAQVLEELTTATTPSMSYVLGDETLAQCGTTATAPSYFLQDGHGNNRQMAQMDGTVYKHYSYDAYGTVQTGNGQVTASSSTAEVAAADDSDRITSKLYCGEQYDKNLQMYNLRARYYAPVNGRFNQRDTFAGNNEDPQSFHKYLYANLDPVNNFDPSGLFSVSEILVVSGIVGIVAGLTTFAVTGSVRASVFVGVLAAVLTGIALLSIVFAGEILEFLQAAIRLITENLGRAWSALRQGLEYLKANLKTMLEKAREAIQKGFVIYIQLPTGYSKTPVLRAPDLNARGKVAGNSPLGIEMGGRGGRLLGLQVYPRVGVSPNAFGNMNTLLRIDYIDYRPNPPTFGLHLHILNWEYNLDEHLPISSLFKKLFP